MPWWTSWPPASIGRAMAGDAGDFRPAAASPAELVAALEERTGCAFPDRELALRALTHKSFVNEHRGEGLSDNERLEFLGDAVIDLAVSQRLMERFPEASEGDLSKLRAALVDEAGLTRLARTLELGPLLRLGRGEELTGGRDKASLLADGLEAVIAVVYLGGGLEPVLRLLDRIMADAFDRAAAGTLNRDYKTQIQELSQSRMRAAPRYRVVSERGPDHEKTFEVELEVRGETLGRGEGRSKKDAEQAAARVALEALSARIAAGALPEQPEGEIPDAPGALPLAPGETESATTTLTTTGNATPTSDHPEAFDSAQGKLRETRRAERSRRTARRPQRKKVRAPTKKRRPGKARPGKAGTSPRRRRPR